MPAATDIVLHHPRRFACRPWRFPRPLPTKSRGSCNAEGWLGPRCSVPLTYNDQPGKWTVRTVDVASGTVCIRAGIPPETLSLSIQFMKDIVGSIWRI